MKIEKTIEVVKCDFCDITEDDDDIQKCDICGKDYCPACGTMFIPVNYDETVEKLLICEKYYKKVFKKDMFKSGMSDLNEFDAEEL